MYVSSTSLLCMYCALPTLKLRLECKPCVTPRRWSQCLYERMARNHSARLFIATVFICYNDGYWRIRALSNTLAACPEPAPASTVYVYFLLFSSIPRCSLSSVCRSFRFRSASCFCFRSASAFAFASLRGSRAMSGYDGHPPEATADTRNRRLPRSNHSSRLPATSMTQATGSQGPAGASCAE